MGQIMDNNSGAFLFSFKKGNAVFLCAGLSWDWPLSQTEKKERSRTRLFNIIPCEPSAN